MDRCARLGPHKASCDPSRRTLSAVSVLPQVLAGRCYTSGGRLQAGGLGWYAPSGLSFPLRFACGPLPLTRPRVAMPSSAPCLSGSYALRVLPLFLASQNLGRKAHFPGVFVPCVPSPGTQRTHDFKKTLHFILPTTV